MAPSTIHVKATSGAKITLDVELSTTVGALKSTLSAEDKANVPAPQQRLIYRGHVLKDDRTLDSYGLEPEHTIHLVKGPAPGGNPPATATAPAPATATAPASTPSAASVPSGGGLGGFGAGPFGDIGGLSVDAMQRELQQVPDLDAMQRELQQNPEVMRQMLNSPFIRDAMDQMAQNPDMLRTMLQSDPRMREVLERNPELNHALNDPEMLRRTFDAARNPELMREQMRLADRAFANVEAHPGGFNALSRMHQDVHEPMMNALSGGGESGRGGGGGGAAATADNPFAQMFAQNPPAGGAATNTPSTNTPSTNTPSTNTPSSAPTAAPWAPSAGAGGDAGSNPFASMFGGAGVRNTGAGGFGSAESQDAMLSQFEQMLSNPAMQQMMTSMMSDPRMMEQMLGSDPRARAALDANPELRSRLTDPEFLRRMSDPANIRAMVQMQRAMAQLQSSGLGGGLGMGMGSGPGPGMDPFAAMMGGGFGGGMGPGPGPAASTEPPETLYASQLAQLKDMGFFDEAQNIRALQATMGNVSAAIERLLSGP